MRTDLRSNPFTPRASSLARVPGRRAAGTGLAVALSAALFASVTLGLVSPATAATPPLKSAVVFDPTTPPIPADVWLDGVLTLYADHVQGTFNGHTIDLQAPVQKVLDYKGGLTINFSENDDYSLGGYDVDSVKVEQGPGMPTTFFDDFASLDPAVWKTTFYDEYHGLFDPAWGTVTVGDSAVSLRPTLYRGGCELYTPRAVVTSLPARVSFRIKCAISDFRTVDLFLFSSDAFDANGRYPGDQAIGWDQPYVHFDLGTTHHLLSTAYQSVSAQWPDLPPVAVAGPDQQVVLGKVANFDGSASHDDGSITSYAWDFGDGSTGSGATTTHTYAAAGTYTATLTVTDDAGLTGTDTLTVTVLQPLAATVRFTPETLNLKSNGKDITCFISAPSGYSPADVVGSTVRITSIGGTAVSIPAMSPSSVNGNRLMVKFDRQAVIPYASDGNVTFAVGGSLTGGAVFSGSDVVRIIH